MEFHKGQLSDLLYLPILCISFSTALPQGNMSSIQLLVVLKRCVCAHRQEANLASVTLTPALSQHEPLVHEWTQSSVCTGFISTWFLLLLFCFTDKMTVLQNQMVKLPCSHTEGDVSWSRFLNGNKIILVSLENGREVIKNSRFGSEAKNVLVILDVRLSDSGMYFCNQSKIYLEVITDPSVVTPVAATTGGPGVGAGGQENQQASDLWKVPVGVAVGAALTLLSVFTWRLCSKTGGGTNASEAQAPAEAIYEEVESVARQSNNESPYSWISMTPCRRTPPNKKLYGTANKTKTKGVGGDDCVYYLTQNPSDN